MSPRCSVMRGKDPALSAQRWKAAQPISDSSFNPKTPPNTHTHTHVCTTQSQASTMDQPYPSIKPTMSSFFRLLAKSSRLYGLQGHFYSQTATKGKQLLAVWHRRRLLVTVPSSSNSTQVKRIPQWYHNSIKLSEKRNMARQILNPLQC